MSRILEIRIPVVRSKLSFLVEKDARGLKSERSHQDEELAEILAINQSPYAERLITPYGKAKYRAEQILLGI
jgi:hypothetical protein